MSEIVQSAQDFLYGKFGLRVTDVKGPFVHDTTSWREHCQRYKINGFNQGAFYPYLMEAHVHGAYPCVDALVCHEFFGHGLFYQSSPLGLTLRKYEDELAEGDESRRKILDKISEERGQSLEGFAVWMEKFILQGLGLGSVWDVRFKCLDDYHKVALELAEQEEVRFGDCGVVYSAFLPKFYSKDDLVELLKHYFGSKFSSVEFAIVHGSQKPESDIDLYVAGDFEKENVFNGWLDLRIDNSERFRKELKCLDLLVLSVLANGELVVGDVDEFMKLKESVKGLPITEEAIRYNLWRASIARENIQNGNFYNLKGAIETMLTSELNARALAQGKKWLSIEDLRSDVVELPLLIDRIRKRLGGC